MSSLKTMAYLQKNRWTRPVLPLLLTALLVVSALKADAKEPQIPLAAGLCISKAEALIQKERLEEAVTVLETFRAKQQTTDAAAAAQKGYTHYYISFLLGNTCLMCSEADAKKRTQWLKRAAGAYEQAVAQKPDLAPAWLNLAKCRYDLGRMQAAATAFIKGYEASADKKADHLYYAAICYFQSNNHHSALQTFNRLIKHHPDQFTLERREAYVSILFAMEQNKTALPHVEILARQLTGQKKKKWQEILFYQYLQLNMEKKALDYGRMLTRTDPTEPKWWKGVSHLYLNRNDLKNGLNHLVIYSFLTPPTREEKKLMADLYLSLGIPVKAIPLYENLLNEKTDTNLFKRIVQACTAAHEPEKAIEWIDKSLALKPDTGLLQRKAGLFYEMKQYERAARVYEELTKGAAKPGEYFLLLGYCAWNLNQPDRARHAFEKAARFHKQKKAAHQALARLNSPH